MMVRRTGIRRETRWPALWGVALVLLALMLGTPGATAQEEDAERVYTVKGIAVEVTGADDPIAARDQAIAQAQRDAFATLMERMVSERTIKTPGDKTLNTLVSDFSILDQAAGADVFEGTFTVRFRRDAVRDWLLGKGVAFTEPASRPLMVLPLYQGPDASRLTLWAEPNPWRRVWDTVAAEDGLALVELPLGDVLDVQEVPPARAMAHARHPLLALARRYGGVGALVVRADLSEATDGRDTLRLEAVRITAMGKVPVLAATLEAGPDEDRDALLTRAARKVREALDSQWKENNASFGGPDNPLPDDLATASGEDDGGLGRLPEEQNTGEDTAGGIANRLERESGGVDDPLSSRPTTRPAETLTATVVLSGGGLGEWLAIRQVLQNAEGMEGMNVASVSRHGARVQLKVRGGAGGLSAALARHGLRVQRLQGGSIRIVPQR